MEALDGVEHPCHQELLPPALHLQEHVPVRDGDGDVAGAVLGEDPGVLLLHVTAEIWALPLGARTVFLADTLVATGSCYWPCRFGWARCKFPTGLQLLYPSLKLLEVGYSFGED